MPVATALLGMPAWLADSGVCARVSPPSLLIALMPSAPSPSVPVSTMPIAHSRCSAASEIMKRSTAFGYGGRSPIGLSTSRPLRSSRYWPGGTT